MKIVRILLVMIMAPAFMVFAHNGSHDGVNSGDHVHNQDGLEMDHNTVIPHMHMGGGYITRITLMNPGSDEDITGVYHFYNQDGSPLSVEINGDSVDSYETTVPAGGINHIDLGNPDDPTTIGYCVFISEGSDTHYGDGEMGTTGDMMNDAHAMMGDHLFAGVIYSRYSSDGDLATQVGTMGMKFMSGMQRGFAVHLVNNENNISGLAMVNTSDSSLDVDLNLKSSDGSLLITKTLTLESGQQVVDILAEFFTDYPDIEDFDGVLEIEADEDGIVPLALVSSNDILTAIPVVMIPGDMVDMGGNGGMMN